LQLGQLLAKPLLYLSLAKTHAAAISTGLVHSGGIIKKRCMTQDRGSLGSRFGFGQGQVIGGLNWHDMVFSRLG
jgi:hypothetical protein